MHHGDTDEQEDRAVAREHEPCRHLAERRVIGSSVARAGQSLADAAEAVLGQRVPESLDDLQQVLEHEEVDQRADNGAHLVANDRADAHAECGVERRRDGPADDQLRHLRAGQPGVDAPRVENGGTDRRREAGGRQPEREAGGQARAELGQGQLDAIGHDEQARRDRAVAELARQRHDAEHQREHLREAGDSEQVAHRRVAGAPGGRRGGDDHDREHQAERAADDAVERAGGPQLEDLGGDQPGHDGPPLASVSSKNTSSSEEPTGVNSETTSWFSAITRPMSSPLRSRTTMSASPLTSAPSATSSSRRRRTSGPATLIPPPLRAISSVSVPCATERPRLMTTTSSAVWETSASTWLETSTARPSGPASAGSRAASGCPAGRGRWRARRAPAPAGRRAARPPGRAAGACRASSRRRGGSPRR